MTRETTRHQIKKPFTKTEYAKRPPSDRSCYLQKKLVRNIAQWEYIGV